MADIIAGAPGNSCSHSWGHSCCCGCCNSYCHTVATAMIFATADKMDNALIYAIAGTVVVISVAVAAAPGS